MSHVNSIPKHACLIVATNTALSLPPTPSPLPSAADNQRYPRHPRHTIRVFPGVINAPSISVPCLHPSPIPLLRIKPTTQSTLTRRVLSSIDMTYPPSTSLPPLTRNMIPFSERGLSLGPRCLCCHLAAGFLRRRPRRSRPGSPPGEFSPV